MGREGGATVEDVTGPEAVSRSATLGLRVVLALGCMLTVAPLLAWVQELGSFTTWFVVCTVPALTAVIVTLVWFARSGRFPDTVMAAKAGIVGGLLGTIAYDLVRLPAVALGRQVLAPIDSYGVLLLSAPASSSVTGFAGWAFHLQNGVFFGLAYALVAAGARIRWAVLFALVLESGAVFGGFADFYHLRGEWALIAIAYAAHVPYGLALGWMTESPARRMEPWERSLGAPIVVCLGVVLVALVLWQQPFAVAESSAIELRSGDFHPQWARVATGHCVAVTNRDTSTAALEDGPSISSGATARLCPTGAGVHRVKVGGRAGSGGFVIVDPAG